MTRWFLLLLASSLVPISAHAATPFGVPLTPPDPAPAKGPRLNLRIVDDNHNLPRPVRQSGMIVQTEVAPNTNIGFGILKVSKGKVGSTDWRIDSKSGYSKRPAVSVEFRF